MRRTSTYTRQSSRAWNGGDQGPDERAAECDPDKLDDAAWERTLVGKKKVKPPTPSYAWATTWMLRAIEAHMVEFGHVKLGRNSKTVSLYIPKSKMDQAARGPTDPDVTCPWALTMRCLARRPDGKGHAPLFPNQDGDRVRGKLEASAGQARIGKFGEKTWSYGLHQESSATWRTPRCPSQHEPKLQKGDDPHSRM